MDILKNATLEKLMADIEQSEKEAKTCHGTQSKK